VAIASSGVKNTDNLPIQELFKNRAGAMLLMAMAVFVAPFFEETVFRGYCTHLGASHFVPGAILGMESPNAVRAGVGSSILVTGVLFGLLHAPQLGWTWGLVSLLITVGVVFTFVRAWSARFSPAFCCTLVTTRRSPLLRSWPREVSRICRQIALGRSRIRFRLILRYNESRVRSQSNGQMYVAQPMND